MRTSVALTAAMLTLAMAAPIQYAPAGRPHGHCANAFCSQFAERGEQAAVLLPRGDCLSCAGRQETETQREARQRAANIAAEDRGRRKKRERREARNRAKSEDIRVGLEVAAGKFATTPQHGSHDSEASSSTAP